MGDVSENFNRSEFACKCQCGKDTVDVDLLKLLEKIRGHFDAPVRINSGNRCATHNAFTGGLSNSQHLYSKAADIVVDNVHPHIVAELARQLDAGGVGDYNTFTHVDVRSGVKARWKG